VTGIDKLLDDRQVAKVHLVGAEMGSYIAAVYHRRFRTRVLTALVCNPILDFDYYCSRDFAYTKLPLAFVPEAMLRDVLTKDYPTISAEMAKRYEEEADQVAPLRCLVDALRLVERETQALGRTALVCRLGWVFEERNHADLVNAFRGVKTVILEAMDQNHVTFPMSVRITSRKLLIDAKVANIHWGGDYPYLANPSEFNMHLHVHINVAKFQHQMASVADLPAVAESVLDEMDDMDDSDVDEKEESSSDDSD